MIHSYGLIGYPLSHSFSKKYFTEKFQKENILNSEYHAFPIDKIELSIDKRQSNIKRIKCNHSV